MTQVSKRPEEFLPLSDNSWNILMVLGDNQPWHGYAINKQLEAEGKSRLGAATYIGPSTASLRIDVIEEVPTPANETDERRVYYHISDLGQQVVKAQITWYKARAQLAQQKPAFNTILGHS